MKEKDRDLGLRDSQATIKISKITLEKIKEISKDLGFAQITVLEYLLNGKINLKELKKYDN